MKKLNQLHTGVILSYINLGIGSIVPLIYTPIMLRLLTQSEYGLYSLASSVISYLSLLNFGLGSAVIRYITKYRVLNNKNDEERIIGLFLFLYSILGILVCIGGIILVLLTDKFFSNGLTLLEITKLKILIIIMSFNTAISFPGSVFSSITISHEKFIFRKFIDMISTIATPIFNLFALFLGFASIGMTLASTILQAIIIPINIIYCFKVLDVRPRFRSMPFNILSEIIDFSAFIFLGSIVDMLYWSTDKVLIGAMIGTASVAIYNVGGTFNNMVQQLALGITGVLTPKITGMVFNNSQKYELSNLLIKTGRLQYIIVSLTVSGFIVFGKQFIIFIAGKGYEESYTIALLTMIPLIVPLIQNVALNIIVAQNKHKFRAIVYLIVAIINVISTVVIIRFYGIIGAAICSCIAFCIGNVLIMNIYYYKVIGLDIVRFWKNIYDMSLVPILMIILGNIFIFYVGIETIRKFLLGVIIYTLIFSILTFKLSMNNYERQIITKPIKRIKNKFIEVYE